MAQSNKISSKKPTIKKRGASSFSFSFGGNKRVQDVRYTPELAFSVPEFFACVNALSSSFASLPVDIFEKGTREKAVDLKLYDLLRNEPNSEQTAFEFYQQLVISLCKWGWFAALIVRDDADEVSQIIPIDNRFIKSVTNSETKETAWEIQTNDGKSLLASNQDVLCINYFSEGSPINNFVQEHLADFIVLAKRVEVFGGEYFQTAINPSGVISSGESLLTQEKWDDFKANFRNYINAVDSGHNFLVLPFNVSYKPFELPDNNKSQFLDTRKFNRSLIQGILRVPAYLVGDLEKSTYTNAETQDIGYAKHTLAPLSENVMQRFRKQLFTPEQKAKYYIEQNFNSLLRGLTKDRAEAYSQLVNCATLTPNEARARENLPPLPGGDELYINSTLVSVASLTNPETQQTSGTQAD